MSRHIAVIGAGWAGCAAAVELVSHGQSVTLFEAARIPGGRARKVTLNGVSLDNGQHILLGAYTETLRMMKLVGIDIDTSLLCLPLQMRYPNNTGMDFVAARLPAPLHLLAGVLHATGLAWPDKLALAGFSNAARKIAWTLEHDCSVTELLQRFRQTERLIKLMWRPLCLAALNTPPDEASAQVFLHVLKDSLGGRRAFSNMLLPRQDLSALFPQQAVDYILPRGGNACFGKRIVALNRPASRWMLGTADGATIAQEFDQVVVATDLLSAAALLEPLRGIALTPPLTYQPITTCYLQYPDDCRLDAAFYALADDPAIGHWGQFVFDRGQLNATQRGVFAVVISAAQQAVLLDHNQLADDVGKQLAAVFMRPEFAKPLWTKVISEKRATFSCTPALNRPDNKSGIENVTQAGDYTASHYPATLEAAVRSGVAAARLLINS